MFSIPNGAHWLAGAAELTPNQSGIEAVSGDQIGMRAKLDEPPAIEHDTVSIDGATGTANLARVRYVATAAGPRADPTRPVAGTRSVAW